MDPNDDANPLTLAIAELQKALDEALADSDDLLSGELAPDDGALHAALEGLKGSVLELNAEQGWEPIEQRYDEFMGFVSIAEKATETERAKALKEATDALEALSRDPDNTELQEKAKRAFDRTVKLGANQSKWARVKSVGEKVFKAIIDGFKTFGPTALPYILKALFGIPAP